MNKICTNCAEEKPETEFHWVRFSKGLRHSKCKKCVLIYAKQYAEKNKEKIKLRNAEASKKKSEERLNNKNPFVSLYKECPDCKQVFYYKDFGLRQHKNGNKSLRSVCIKCQYQRAKSKPLYLTKAKERQKKRAEQNPDKHRESVKAWKAANPAKVAKHKNGYQQKRMIRCAEQSDGTITHEVMKKLFASAISCVYCGKLFNGAVAKSLDHKTPLSRGGAHSINNVVISCLPCNVDKSTMTAEEYVSKQKTTC